MPLWDRGEAWPLAHPPGTVEVWRVSRSNTETRRHHDPFAKESRIETFVSSGQALIMHWSVSDLLGDDEGLPADRGGTKVARHRIEHGQVGAAYRPLALPEREPTGRVHLHSHRLRPAGAGHARKRGGKGSTTLRQLVATHLGHAHISEGDIHFPVASECE